jgi:hypothetical protein
VRIVAAVPYAANKESKEISVAFHHVHFTAIEDIVFKEHTLILNESDFRIARNII